MIYKNKHWSLACICQRFHFFTSYNSNFYSLINLKLLVFKWCVSSGKTNCNRSIDKKTPSVTYHPFCYFMAVVIYDNDVIIGISLQTSHLSRVVILDSVNPFKTNPSFLKRNFNSSLMFFSKCSFPCVLAGMV